MPEIYTPAQRVKMARDSKRPNIRDYIDGIFDSVFETHGDRLYGDDPAIFCGIARFEVSPGEWIPVTVAGHVKGKNLNENVACNFGMPNPQGYRKFQRAIAQAEKFGRPVITFIDTPGAYPGTQAEELGQGEAIARCLYNLSALRTPVLAIVTGEGGSGGALALGVADKVLMMENSIYSVLSPEGFASILWKDSSRSGEASAVMKLTAEDLLGFGVISRIIEEPAGGAGKKPKDAIENVRKAVAENLKLLLKKDIDSLVEQRYEAFRSIGVLG